MVWAVAKGHTLGKTVTYQMEAEAACINIVKLEDQRRDPNRPTAPRGPFNNLDRLVNWSQDFLNRQQETESTRPQLAETRKWLSETWS